MSRVTRQVIVISHRIMLAMVLLLKFISLLAVVMIRCKLSSNMHYCCGSTRIISHFMIYY